MFRKKKYFYSEQILQSADDTDNMIKILILQNKLDI